MWSYGLAAVGLLFGVFASVAAQEIRVGYAYEKRVDLSPYYAIEVWAQQVNSSGGILINGTAYFIRTFAYDNDGDCTNDMLLYEYMITTIKVHILIAPPGSCGVSADIAEQYGVPMLNSENSVIAWVHNANHSFTFTLFPRITGVTGSCVAAVVEKGGKNAIMAYQPSDVLLALQRISNLQYGLNIVQELVLDPSRIAASTPTATFNAYVDAIIANWTTLNADFLIWSGGGGVPFLQRMRLARFQPPATFVWSGPNLIAFRETAGWMGVGLLSVSGWDVTENFTDPVFGSSQGYVQAFTRAWNVTPDTYSAVISTAGVVASEVIRITQSLDPDVLRLAIKNYNATTLYGPTSFNAQNLFGVDDPCWQVTASGGYVPVYPHTFPTAEEIVYPAVVPYPPPPPPPPINYGLIIGLSVGLGLGLILCVIATAILIHYLRGKYAVVFIPKGEVAKEDEESSARWDEPGVPRWKKAAAFLLCFACVE